ncbi:thiaminase II [Actinomycetes bacterium NPDC127524]
MTFTQIMHVKVRDIWAKTHRHPFIAGIGTGELPKEVFIRYMKQDYIFLIEYSRLFALGVLKARDVQNMSAFSAILNETLHSEMELHRKYAREFAISIRDLEDSSPTPINLAYTGFMLNAGQNGSLAELAAALLPCMWSYWEIGNMLKEKYPGSDAHPLYGEWVTMYASEEFGKSAKWLINLLDSLADGQPKVEIENLTNLFITSSRFEYLFWDSVYKGDDWPV